MKCRGINDLEKWARAFLERTRNSWLRTTCWKNWRGRDNIPLLLAAGKKLNNSFLIIVFLNEWWFFFSSSFPIHFRFSDWFQCFLNTLLSSNSAQFWQRTEGICSLCTPPMKCCLELKKIPFQVSTRSKTIRLGVPI